MFNDIMIFAILFMISTSAAMMAGIFVREMYLVHRSNKKHIF